MSFNSIVYRYKPNQLVTVKRSKRKLLPDLLIVLDFGG